MPFGSVLKRLRMQNDLTQKQLADVLGISESTVGMYERGHREPAFELLETIADYFNVDMDYLTGRTDVERKYSFSPSSPSLSFSPDEVRLVSDYREASAEIREEAAAMLHRSAERNRKESTMSSSNAG